MWQHHLISRLLTRDQSSYKSIFISKIVSETNIYGILDVNFKIFVEVECNIKWQIFACVNINPRNRNMEKYLLCVICKICFYNEWTL